MGEDGLFGLGQEVVVPDQADADVGHHQLAEHLEASDHGVFRPPQSQGDQRRDDDNGDQVAQHHPDGESRRQAARENAQRDGDDAAEDSLRHDRPVLFLQNSHSDGDGEHHGRPQHGAGEYAAQHGRLMACRQLHRQRAAAHVAGENRSGKHGGVSPQKGEHRHDHRLE